MKKDDNIQLTIGQELAGLFEQDAPLTIFDIGSCDGIDAIRYSKAFPKARVFAFEPIPTNFAKIQSNVSQQNAANVKAYNIAMSDKRGTANMFVSATRGSTPENDQAGNKSSSLLAPDKHLEVYPHVAFGNSLEVQTETLQTFCDANGLKTIDFIHLDVQGAELLVMKGAGIFIDRIHAIWMEVEHIALYKNQPLRKEVEAFMKANGFKLLKFRVGGFSGDQLYVNQNFLKAKLGPTGYFFAEIKGSILTSRVNIFVQRYLRKLKFLLRLK